MVVYIQKKVGKKWLTILPVGEERAHRTCNHLMRYNLTAEFRIVKNSEAD